MRNKYAKEGWSRGRGLGAGSEEEWHEAASRVGVEGQCAGQRTLPGLGRHRLTQISA